MKEPLEVRVLRTTPAKGWRAVYAVRDEHGGARLEEEPIGVFALCEDEQGRRFVSGVGENGELYAMREGFVGHFSVKEPRYKIQEAAGRFARANEQQ